MRDAPWEVLVPTLGEERLWIWNNIDCFRIFISDVLPGPAFGNLVVGDIILKINGIDMTKAEKPQATTILKGLDFDFYIMMTSLLCHTVWLIPAN